MTETADRTPTVVFANETEEGAVVITRCHLRHRAIRDDEGAPTEYAGCAYLSRPHLTGDHYLTLERVRYGAGAIYAVTRNEDGEQVGWSTVNNDPVRTLL